jgi:hypothetical protein
MAKPKAPAWGLGASTFRPDQQIAQDETCDFWVTSKE